MKKEVAPSILTNFEQGMLLHNFVDEILHASCQAFKESPILTHTDAELEVHLYFLDGVYAVITFLLIIRSLLLPHQIIPFPQPFDDELLLLSSAIDISHIVYSTNQHTKSCRWRWDSLPVVVSKWLVAS